MFSMEIITLILPLEAVTDFNSSNSSGVRAGAIAGVTAGVISVVLIE